MQFLRYQFHLHTKNHRHPLDILTARRGYFVNTYGTWYTTLLIENSPPRQSLKRECLYWQFSNLRYSQLLYFARRPTRIFR